jgi:uncharacterized membrane protein
MELALNIVGWVLLYHATMRLAAAMINTHIGMEAEGVKVNNVLTLISILLVVLAGGFIVKAALTGIGA